MPRRFDVAVVGSGPAGAACALRLRASDSPSRSSTSARSRGRSCAVSISTSVRCASSASWDWATCSTPRAAAERDAPVRARRSRGLRFSSSAYSVSREILENGFALRRWRPARKRLPPPSERRAQRFRRRDDRLAAVREILEISTRYWWARTACARRSRAVRSVRSGRRRAVRDRGALRRLALSHWIEMYASGNGYIALIRSRRIGERGVRAQSRAPDARAQRPRRRITRFSVAVTDGSRRVENERLQGKRNSIGPISARKSQPAAKNLLLVGDCGGVRGSVHGTGRVSRAVGRAAPRPRRSSRAAPCGGRERVRVGESTPADIRSG